MRASRSAMFSSSRRERVTSAPVAYSQSSGLLFAMQRPQAGLLPSHLCRARQWKVGGRRRANCAYRLQFSAWQTGCAPIEGSTRGCSGHVSCVCMSWCACVVYTPCLDEAVLYRSIERLACLRSLIISWQRPPGWKAGWMPGCVGLKRVLTRVWSKSV